MAVNPARLSQRTSSMRLCVARIAGVAEQASLGSCRLCRRSARGRCPESSGGRLRRPRRLSRVACRPIVCCATPKPPEPHGANSRSRCFAATPDGGDSMLQRTLRTKRWSNALDPTYPRSLSPLSSPNDSSENGAYDLQGAECFFPSGDHALLPYACRSTIWREIIGERQR